MYIYIWLYRADDIRTPISTHPRIVPYTDFRSLTFHTNMCSWCFGPDGMGEARKLERGGEG